MTASRPKLDVLERMVRLVLGLFKRCFVLAHGVMCLQWNISRLDCRGRARSTAAACTEGSRKLCDAELGWASEEVILFVSCYSSGMHRAACSHDSLQEAKEVVTRSCTAADIVLCASAM